PLASGSGAAKCIDCGWTSPRELMGREQKRNPAPPKRDTGSCVLSLAEFVERPQAGTNRRFARSIASSPTSLRWPLRRASTPEDENRRRPDGEVAMAWFEGFAAGLHRAGEIDLFART